jgi:hypothetical protein
MKLYLGITIIIEGETIDMRAVVCNALNVQCLNDQRSAFMAYRWFAIAMARATLLQRTIPEVFDDSIQEQDLKRYKDVRLGFMTIFLVRSQPV